MKRLPILALTCALALVTVSPAFAGNKAAKGAKPTKAERQEKRKLIREYDKNEDGKIEGAEAETLRKAFDADKTGPVKSLDKNSDGKLDDTEIAALKSRPAGAKGKAAKPKRRTSSPPPPPTVPGESALRELTREQHLMLLMTQHQRRIFSYIYTLVPNRPDAEDILQQTSLIACEKFDAFTLGTDFAAWACQIAYWQVRAARQKFARAKVIFNDELVETLAQTASELSVEVSARHEALAHCLQKLHPRDRELVLTRYEPGSSVDTAARRSGRTLDAAYKALTRLRKLLLDCVTNQLSLGDTA